MPGAPSSSSYGAACEVVRIDDRGRTLGADDEAVEPAAVETRREREVAAAGARPHRLREPEGVGARAEDLERETVACREVDPVRRPAGHLHGPGVCVVEDGIDGRLHSGGRQGVTRRGRRRLGRGEREPEGAVRRLREACHSDQVRAVLERLPRDDGMTVLVRLCAGGLVLVGADDAHDEDRGVQLAVRLERRGHRAAPRRLDRVPDDAAGGATRRLRLGLREAGPVRLPLDRRGNGCDRARVRGNGLARARGGRRAGHAEQCSAKRSCEEDDAQTEPTHPFTFLGPWRSGT